MKPPIVVPTTRRASIDVAAAEGLADQHGRGHAEAEHEGRQQEHDQIGVGRRRQRVLAQRPADPDRVDRAVQRLEDGRDEGRKGEGEQGPADRPRWSGRAAPGVTPSAEPGQRRAIFLRVRRLFGMVGARLLDRLGLGALDEARIGEPRGEGIALLFGGLGGLGEPRLLGGDVDHAFERQDEGRLVDHDLSGAARRQRRRLTGSIRASLPSAAAWRSRRSLGQRSGVADVQLQPGAPDGTFSSERAARMPLTSRISQSISGPASGSSARASGIGHLARISG